MRAVSIALLMSYLVTSVVIGCKHVPRKDQLVLLGTPTTSYIGGKIIYKQCLLATLEDTIFWLTSVSLKCTRSPELAILGTVIPVDLYPIFSPWFSMASVKCSILYMYRRLLLPSTCRNHIVVVFIYLTHFFSTMSSKFITVVPQSNCGNAQASQLLGEYGLPMSFEVESSISTKHIFKTISIK